MNTESNINTGIITSENLLKLKKSELHIVCPAIKRNSYAEELLLNQFRVSVYDFDKFCNAVNVSVDPGCLYPKYYITLFPLEINKPKSIENCVKEVIKANEQYFKTKDLLVAFDDSYIGREETLSEFKSILESLDTTNMYLKNWNFL